jgi:uncharacterized membrane protein YfcA
LDEDVSWSVESAVLLVALGLGVGALGTLVGAGGGFLLTPVLLLLYPHTSPEQITSISLGAVLGNSASGSLAYARQRRIDYRSGLVFAVATLPGAVGGALVVGHVPRRAFDAVTAVVLAVLAGWIAWRPEPRRRSERGAERVVVERGGRVWRYRVPMVRGFLLSAVVGFLSSFLGIGGGVFHVPILVSLLGFPTHVATATSHFVLAIMSGAAVATHGVEGAYRVGNGLRRTLALGLGVVVGAQAGARASVSLSGTTIQRLLAVALALVAIRLAFGL